jgi:hypothetical protein
VAQLVDGFFKEALAEQGIIPIESVELLVQAVGGNQGARAAHLGFSENVLQDWDVEIDIGNGKETPVMRTHQSLHALQEFGGMILLALGVI